MILQHVLSLVNAGYSKDEINAMIASETPNAETPKTETPKTETPNAETPKTETPKTETPNAETPMTESPTLDYDKLAAAIVKAQKNDAFHTDHSGGLQKPTDLGQYF